MKQIFSHILFLYIRKAFLIYKNATPGMHTVAYKVGVASDRQAQECALAHSLFYDKMKEPC